MHNRRPSKCLPTEQIVKQSKNIMKIKILGITVFEMEPSSSATSSGKPPARSAAPSPMQWTRAVALPAPRPLADLLRADDCLPRTRYGTLDVDAALHMFGIKDVAILWQRKYPSGSSGASIKRAIGSLGRKPAQPAERHRPKAKESAPSEGIGAGGLVQPVMATKRESPLTDGATEVLTEREDPASHHQYIDIAAALRDQGISDPKTLWRDKVRPGSLEHKLKKEIARRLARGETVAGMTRRDIGLPE
jgi:hypothetical protein